MSEKRIKVIAIVGPTASGKTELAVFLARKFNGELISADSRQVYKGMDIGTAKIATDLRISTDKNPSSQPSPSRGEGDKGIIHLIDVATLGEEYNVVDFQRDASKLIKDISKKGKLPIIVGGTGLWVEALLEGYQPAPKVEPKLRNELARQLMISGLSTLVKKLKKLDPEAADSIDLNNPRRVIRALEVYLQTGHSILKQRFLKAPKYDYLMIGIDIAREKLYKIIDKRVEQMFKLGLEKEVKSLVKKYGKVEALNAIGYKEFIATDQTQRVPFGADSTDSTDQIKEEIKKNTRNLAKRQMTWWRRKNVKWIKNKKEVEGIVKDFVMMK